MFKKGHEPKKNTVIFVKTRQKPAVEKPEAGKGQDVSPTTTLMYRSTLGESSVFKARSQTEKLMGEGNKGAQLGKTPLELWHATPAREYGC